MEITYMNIVIRKNTNERFCKRSRGELWYPVGTACTEDIFPSGTTFEIRYYARDHQPADTLDPSKAICCATMLYNGCMTSINMNAGHFSWMDPEAVDMGELVVQDQTMHRTGTFAFRLHLKRSVRERSSSVENLWTVQSLYDLATLYGHVCTLQQWKQLAFHLGFVEEEIDELELALRQTSSLNETSSPVTPKRAFCLLYHCFQRQGGTPVQFIRGLRTANKKQSFDCLEPNPPNCLMKKSMSSLVTSNDSHKVLSGIKEAHFTCLCETRLRENYESARENGLDTISKDKDVHSIRCCNKRDNSQLKSHVKPSTGCGHVPAKKSWLKEAKRCRSSVTLNVSDLLNTSKSKTPKQDLATPVKRVTTETSPTLSGEFQLIQPSAKKARMSESAPGTSRSVAIENRAEPTAKCNNKTRMKRKRSRCIDTLKSTKQFLLPDLWHPRLIGKDKSPNTILSTVRTKLEETRQQTAEFHHKLNELMQNLDRKDEGFNPIPRIQSAFTSVPAKEPLARTTLTDEKLWRLASFFEHTDSPSWQRLINMCGLDSDELTQQIEQASGQDTRIAVYLVLLYWLEKQSNPSLESPPSLSGLFALLKSAGFEKFVSHCVCQIERMNVW